MREEEQVILNINSDQLALERQMADLGVQRYRTQQNKALEAGRLSVTTPGRRLLVEAVHGLVEHLKVWTDAAAEKPGPRTNSLAVILQLDPYAAAALTIQAMMDGAASGAKRSSTICRIATLLRDEAMMGSLKEQHGPRFAELSSSKVPRHHRICVAKKWIREGLWSYDIPLRSDQMQAALVLFTLALDHTDLFVVHMSRGARYTQAAIFMTEETIKWIAASHKAHEALTPMYLPMVQEPLDWTQDSIGGYRSNIARRKPLARLQRRSHIDECRAADMPLVYSGVNLAQKTAWRVQADVLAVAQELWANNSQLAGLPDQEAPDFPEKPTDAEELKRWKGIKTDALMKYREEGSSRLRHARTLSMANKFVGKTLYFPHHLDFRARLYPVPPWLNHQGPDFARALLSFDRGSRVEFGSPAARLFKRTGDDLWGGDLRQQCTTSIALWVSQDPLDCLEWSKAKKPWQFLAWCLDAGPWLADEGHLIHVPIHADGSNNGLQIYSLLMRDEELARATNVSPGPKADLYQTVADNVWARVKADPCLLAKQWRAFLPDGLDRDATKRPVMTWPYGVKRYSGHRYLREWLRAKERETNTRPWGVSNWQASSYLFDILWDEIEGLIQPAVRCMDWLRDIAEIIHPHSIRWTTPVGFPVHQDYPKVIKRKVKAVVADTIRYVRFRGCGNETARRQQVNGLPPNFIHSLDSAAMLLTINRAAEKGIKDFAMIHDSYGCPAGDAPLMATTLRECFAEIFSEDLLDSLARDCNLYLPEVTIPDPPSLGNLDPTVVINSEHFFN